MNKYKGLKLDIKADNRNDAIQNGIKYLNLCIDNNHTIPIPKFPENHIPLLSIVIPIHNRNNTIRTTIISVQKSKFK